MAFESGNNHGKGRIQGSKNKANQTIKDSFLRLVENNLEQLDRDIKSLTAKDRLKAVIELSKFLIPTIKQIDIDAEMGSKADLGWLDSFTEEELQTLLNKENNGI
jgi:hypothetical protein